MYMDLKNRKKLKYVGYIGNSNVGRTTLIELIHEGGIIHTGETKDSPIMLTDTKPTKIKIEDVIKSNTYKSKGQSKYHK